MPGSDRPLLLIHGFTDTARTWDALRPHLSGYRLIAPTLLGHHGGPPVGGDLTDPLAAMADELERTLDAAGVQRLPIVGNSLGGWLAFVLAARGRASAVLALSPAFGWPSEMAPGRTRRQFARAHRMAPLGARYAEALAARPWGRRLALWEVVAHPERIAPAQAASLIRGAADCPIFERYWEHMDTGQYRSGWRDFDVPTVIAWGTRDRTIPHATSSAWFRDALPAARWLALPGCGHLPQHDDPELVAAVVREVAG